VYSNSLLAVGLDVLYVVNVIEGTVNLKPLSPGQ